MGGESLQIHFPGLQAGPSPKHLHKNTESPSNTLEETENQIGILHRRLVDSRDTTLFLLQNLGFLINKVNCTSPNKTMEFLGIKIDSEEMTFSIPNQKIQEIVYICQKPTG